MHAARTRGCRVTTVTISRRQYELARRRVAEAGLADLVEVVLRDYRELDGRYDKLVSIEMIEAVGHQYLDTYFRACSERLRPNGTFLLEAITVTDQDWEASKRSVEFIKRYIFPGGSLPSVWAIADSTKRVSDMRMLHLEEISDHYARTLSEWRRRMHANLGRMRALGLPESFLRMWEFYLCYCEGGFAERIIGTVQILFEKPRGRRAPVDGEISDSTSARSTAATVGTMHAGRTRHDA
jgi:cyclopropane-fatty-acyl-phospholipid synthase